MDNVKRTSRHPSASLGGTLYFKILWPDEQECSMCDTRYPASRWLKVYTIVTNAYFCNVISTVSTYLGFTICKYHNYCLWFRNVAVPLHISAQQLCFVTWNCLSYYDSSGGIYRPTTSRNTIKISTARILQSLQTMIGILLPSGLIWASQSLYII